MAYLWSRDGFASTVSGAQRAAQRMVVRREREAVLLPWLRSSALIVLVFIRFNARYGIEKLPSCERSFVGPKRTR
jgi:hypothetical protein